MILSTCQQLYHEGRELLYGQTRFEFSAPGELWDFYDTINFNYDNFGLIQRITLIIDLDEGSSEDNYALPWEEFFVCDDFFYYFPKLSKLDIDFRRFGRHNPTKRYSTDPKIQGILHALRGLTAPLVRIHCLEEEHEDIPSMDDDQNWSRFEPTSNTARELEELMSTNTEWLEDIRRRANEDEWPYAMYGRDD